jgi:hypothetical protein
MDAKDIALLLAAGYVAVMALVRLMARHRDRLIERFRHDIEQHRLAEQILQKASQRKAS